MLDNWSRVMPTPAAKLLKKKSEVVKITKTTTRISLLGFTRRLRFLKQPRHMFLTTGSTCSVTANTSANNGPIRGKHCEIALPLCVFNNPRMLVKT